jgi:hypothetical protein
MAMVTAVVAAADLKGSSLCERSKRRQKMIARHMTEKKRTKKRTTRKKRTKKRRGQQRR